MCPSLGGEVDTWIFNHNRNRTWAIKRARNRDKKKNFLLKNGPYVKIFQTDSDFRINRALAMLITNFFKILMAKLNE